MYFYTSFLKLHWNKKNWFWNINLFSHCDNYYGVHVKKSYIFLLFAGCRKKKFLIGMLQESFRRFFDRVDECSSDLFRFGVV